VGYRLVLLIVEYIVSFIVAILRVVSCVLFMDGSDEYRYWWCICCRVIRSNNDWYLERVSLISILRLLQFFLAQIPFVWTKNTTLLANVCATGNER
jgi:hypothetical protein